MAALLELNRCWRDVRTAPESPRGGYVQALFDEDDAGALARMGLYHLQSLAKHECLVLLGRPGAGKTSEIERICSGQVQGFAEECCVSVSCKEIDADIDCQVARMPEWGSAVQQFKPVRLAIDALDEGYLRDPRYFAALKVGLKNLRSQHPNLRLLLACRPAEWDTTFGKAVHDLWRGQEEPAAYILEPLPVPNQQVLVKSWGINDPVKMLRWVRLNKFEEFAEWPRSLKWLADQFVTGETERIAYTELCRRRAMRSFPIEDKRLEESGRGDRAEYWTHALMLVAAVVVFCGKKGVSLDGNEQAFLSLDEMFQAGSAIDMPKRPSLNRVTVREAVRTSDLMEVRDSCHRFQNQSDLEFLAAAMLVSLELEQLSELFGCADDIGQWRVFPQLATTAANLATQSREFFGWLLKHDPRVLMRVDFASKSTEDKVAAIAAMLAATAEANATSVHDQQSHFATLRNPQIGEELRPWLFDQSRSWAVRQLAFDIAFASCGSEFWIEFDRLASDNQDEFLQSQLPSVVLNFGRFWPEERLKEMAGLPDNRLAGAAMNALLDQGWKPGALAQFLREPSGETITSYEVLVGRRLPRECNTDDIPPLLAKISHLSSAGAQAGETRTLAEALISKGVTALNREDVRQSLTEFVVARIRADDWFFHGSDSKSLARLGLDNTEHRRAFLLMLCHHGLGDTPQAHSLEQSVPLLSDDYPWLLDELAKAQGHSASVLARLASSFVWQLGDECAELIDSAYHASSELRALFPLAEGLSFFAQLRRWRLEADERQRIQTAEFRSQIERPRYSHEEHLEHALNACRAGHLEWWKDVCYALSHPSSQNDCTKFVGEADIRELPGWQSASDELRTELTKFAHGFLLQDSAAEPPGRALSEALFGIVYALSLHASRLNTDAALRAAARPIWIQALMRHGGSESQKIAGYLLSLTDATPTVAARGYERELRSAWDGNEPIFSELLSNIWSSQLEDAITTVLESSPIQPTSYQSGLKMLFERNPVRATALARHRLLEHAGLPDSEGRRAAIGVCLFTINSLWEEAWPYLPDDMAATRRLITECRRLLDLPWEEKNSSMMPTPFIAGLYEVMLKAFPLNKTPRREVVHTLVPEDEAYDLQSSLKEALEQRGAYKELKAALAPYPDLYQARWVGSSLERAMASAHALRRLPPNPVEFIRFLVTAGGTFVRDNDTLRNAVMASLRRFDSQLHPYAISSLWEKEKPRREETLQIEITRHLEKDFKNKGIVINMEVKIQGKQGVDILVEAPPFSVTIEVKQAHATDKNRPVRESMRLQLRDIYLASSHRTHGIYVVGWYFCPTYRPQGLPDMKSIEDAQAYFISQAVNFSTDGFSLASVVLDCRWRESITGRANRAKLSQRKRASKRP